MSHTEVGPYSIMSSASGVVTQKDPAEVILTEHTVALVSWIPNSVDACQINHALHSILSRLRACQNNLPCVRVRTKGASAVVMKTDRTRSALQVLSYSNLLQAQFERSQGSQGEPCSAL